MTETSSRAKGIFAVCLFAMLTLLGAVSVVSYLKINLSSNSTEILQSAEAPTVTSFRELYPFEGEEAKEKTTENEEDSGLLSAYKKSAAQVTEAVDWYTAEGNLLFSPLQSLAWLYDDLVQNPIVENGDEPFVRLDNGYFAYVVPYSFSTEACEGLSDFSAWLQEQNIPLLNIIPPSKSDDSEVLFPAEVGQGYAQTAEEYLNFLSENGLSYMETKDILLSENGDFCSWFYKTDHHWNVRAARLIAEETAKTLNTTFRVSADTEAIAAENFSLTVYPDSFLGTMGQRLGESYREDMEVYYPVTDTCFCIQIPSVGLDRTGSFENTLIAQKYLSEQTAYSAFLYGDQPLVTIENCSCTNGTRVLVLKKSNGDILCPYLACAVQYLDVIDPRYFDGSIRTYIQQTQPDIVLTCFGIPQQGDEAVWDLK